MLSRKSRVLEECFSCPICLEVMDNPSTTVCGHNFCYSCIIKNNYECAICRTVLLKNELVINFQLKKTIEVMKAIEEEQKKSFNSYINSNSTAYKQNKRQLELNTNVINTKLNNYFSENDKTYKYRIKRRFSMINCMNLNSDIYEKTPLHCYDKSNTKLSSKNSLVLNNLLDKILVDFQNDTYGSISNYQTNSFKNVGVFNQTHFNSNLNNINISIYNFEDNYPKISLNFYNDGYLNNNNHSNFMEPNFHNYNKCNKFLKYSMP